MDSIFNVYSIYDIKAQKYGPLFEATNDEVAARQFVQVLQKIQPIFRTEYKLYKIGSFDFVSGSLDQNEKPFEIPLIYNVDKIMEVKE